MAMVIRRPTGRSGGLRRSTRGNDVRPVEWIRSCYGLAGVGTSSTTSQVLVSAADFDDFTRPTVVRIIGSVFVEYNDLALGLNAQLVMGITMVNPGEPAPSPFLQARGNRWLWWNCVALSARDPEEYGVSAWRIPFDIKAMRKRLVEGSELLFVIDNVDPASSGAGYAVGASTLVKE